MIAPPAGLRRAARSLIALLAVLLTLLGTAAPAAAQEPAGALSPLQVDLALDLPIGIGAAAIGLVPEIFKGELSGPACALACDPAGLNALDRAVIGNHLAGAAAASDALLISGIALPFVVDLIDVAVQRGRGRWLGLGKDVLVLAEVLSLNFLATNVVKFAVRRPRPLTYDPTLDPATRSAADAGLSFYSGHSSTTFAMATAYSLLFTWRHPGSRLIVPVWLSTHLLATATAVLRVEAGRHFWTDVLTGAIAGSAVGLLVTSLHHRGAPRPAKGTYTTRLLPAAMPGGGGIMLSLTEN